MDRRNPELGPIASHATAVLSSFRILAEALSEKNDEYTQGITTIIENESVRFRMWVGNLAAHQSGRASLDHRLRDATHLKKQVLYLLDDLNDSLLSATIIISDEDSSSLSPESDDDENSSSSLSSFSEIGNFSPSERFPTVCADIREAIDCLLRLSVAIANPAPHERFRRLGGGASEDMSRFEVFDIRHVQDTFPQVTEELATILGRAITRRRQFFAYRKAHHAKLAAGLEDSNKEAQDNMTEAKMDTEPTEIIPSTVASSLPEYLKKAEINTESGLPNTIDEDQWSYSGMTETSYATSAGFIATEQDLEGQAFKPPPPLRVPPLLDTKGTFECPLCYRMITATSRGSWKRHVFGDLRPYTCVFPHCPESSADFDRRHRWQLHVANIHWRTWICPFQCSAEDFSTAEDLKLHIHRNHLLKSTEERLTTITTLGETAAPDNKTNPCPLCGHTLTGLKAYIKHVGRHLEQLALHVLPPQDAGEEAGNASEDDNSSNEDDETENELSVMCDICRFQPKDDAQWEAHKNVNHSIYNCAYPGCKYQNSPENFMQHLILENHWEGKELKHETSGDACEFCPYRAIRHSSRPRAEVIRHTAETHLVYKCPFTGCEYKNTLDRMRRHQNNKGHWIERYVVKDNPESLPKDLKQIKNVTLIERLDVHGQTLLARACARGEYQLAKERLVERPMDIDVADQAGNTPLHISAINGYSEIVKLLLDAGCNIKCMNNDKDTPLLDAVENGHIEIIQLLLDAGVDPRIPNANGEEPLDRVNDRLNNAAEIRIRLLAAKQKFEDSPMGQLKSIELYFRNTILPQCQDFVTNPPTNTKEGMEEHGRLTRLVLDQVFSKICEVVDNGPDGSTGLKNSLGKEVQGVIRVLDSVLQNMDTVEPD